MGYLRLYDYIANIQTPQLNQLLQNVDDKRILKEAVSQAQITSYLIQKYDCDMEFQPTTVFSLSATYKANQLVEFNYPAWLNTVSSYAVNSLVSYTDGNCYICIQATTVAHEIPTNTAYWTKIGKQYDLYFITYPVPLFQESTNYIIGDKVYWKGYVYTCLIPSLQQDHISQLQAGTYNNIPLKNTFPDDKINGVEYWGHGVAYSITGVIPSATDAWVSTTTYSAGQKVSYNGIWYTALTTSTNALPPTHLTDWEVSEYQNAIWTYGDNRNAQIVECMIWITIWKLGPLISPRNIPELWQKKYDEYLTWLQMCAEGDVTLTAPEKQPAQGARIRFGGKVKQVNGY